MTNHVRTLLAAGLVLCAVAVSRAADPPAGDPKPQPAPGTQEGQPAADPLAPAAKPDAAADASDARARDILGRAARLQNAGDLAEPGRLTSFHVVFQKATFERQAKGADGAAPTQLVETDTDGLVFDWKQGSVMTAVTIDGATTTKAWYDPRKIGWISDGATVSSLLGADHKADYDQLQFHRKVIDQLLDVAILGKMLRDGSRWRVLDDSAPYEKTVAIERIPAADAKGAAAIKLWIAHPAADAFGDVVAASMPPSSANAATTVYEFQYHESFPAVRVRADAPEPVASAMRFPFHVVVKQQADEPGAEPRKVLEVFTRSVDVNTVPDAAFAQPRAK